MSATQAKSEKPSNDPKAEKIDSREDFEAQIALLREEMALLKAQLSSSGERSAAAARRAAISGAEHIRAQGEAALDDIRASARDMEAQIVMTVREKPVTSLAIAAGVGFLFALIARR
ncbi:hypothetical protein ABGN05_11610 [Aquibium sp. LZ166]|uniref:DUF883 domain-containing protein n=1 Tax=Aquibium pacificus TaxID=3153579 RepID=A0ABV3SJ73_9HYPH